MGDMRLLKSFVNAAAELLGFIEASVQQQAKGSKGASLMEHPDVQESLHALREAAQRGPFHDEAAAPVWPSQEDAFLNRLLVKYAQEVNGDSRRAALWTAAAVAEQVGMLWVMHLRSLCALRGVKPTEVLGSDVLLRLRGFEKRWCLFGFDTEEASQGVDLSIYNTGNIKVCSLNYLELRFPLSYHCVPHRHQLSSALLHWTCVRTWRLWAWVCRMRCAWSS